MFNVFKLAYLTHFWIDSQKGRKSIKLTVMAEAVPLPFRTLVLSFGEKLTPSTEDNYNVWPNVFLYLNEQCLPSTVSSFQKLSKCGRKLRNYVAFFINSFGLIGSSVIDFGQNKSQTHMIRVEFSYIPGPKIFKIRPPVFWPIFHHCP